MVSSLSSDYIGIRLTLCDKHNVVSAFFHVRRVSFALILREGGGIVEKETSDRLLTLPPRHFFISERCYKILSVLQEFLVTRASKTSKVPCGGTKWRYEGAPKEVCR